MQSPCQSSPPWAFCFVIDLNDRCQNLYSCVHCIFSDAMNATIERYGMSSSALQEMLAQRAEIEKKIAELQSESRTEAIAKVRTLMAETGLTMADITGSAQKEPKEPKAKSAVAIKYRNAATGETWTGRGLKPRWLTTAIAGGASIESFLA